MILAKVFEKFATGSPVCVMIRACMEHALSEKFVNEIFERTAQRQYTRELLFSDGVDLLGSVVGQVFPSVNAAYQKQRDRFDVSHIAVYGKLRLVEPVVLRALLVQTSQRLGRVVAKLQRGTDRKPLLTGFSARILDGNHLAATERRLEVLRDVAAGPLPGQALVVYDPDRRLLVDVFPCEDGHAQERSLLVEVLDSQEPGEAWIADRNFCTSLWLFQTAVNQACFLVRQHATNVRWEPTGELRKIGRTDSGVVYQQRVTLFDGYGGTLSARRITIRLDKPTEDGDVEIHLLTNLPNRLRATRIAEVYRSRWQLEGVFGELATALHCEIPGLGYPPAALFAFVLGLVIHNILSVTRTALASVHGDDRIDELSAYYLADEIRGMMRGMLIAIPDERWSKQFGELTPQQMSNTLRILARHVNLAQFRKHKRGPKKSTAKRTKYRDKPHVATARLLAANKLH
jgi:IS4 transposase